jgi:hypothetical protein
MRKAFTVAVAKVVPDAVLKADIEVRVGSLSELK